MTSADISLILTFTNVSISLGRSYSVQCRRGLYFQASVLYLSFGTCKGVNIKQLLVCSSSMYMSSSTIFTNEHEDGYLEY